MISVGDLLNNGSALVLHVTTDFVFCFDMDKREYVSWSIDSKNNTFCGHYFSDIFCALGDYKKRVFKDLQVLSSNKIF